MPTVIRSSSVTSFGKVNGWCGHTGSCDASRIATFGGYHSGRGRGVDFAKRRRPASLVPRSTTRCFAFQRHDCVSVRATSSSTRAFCLEPASAQKSWSSFRTMALPTGTKMTTIWHRSTRFNSRHSSAISSSPFGSVYAIQSDDGYTAMSSVDSDSDTIYALSSGTMSAGQATAVAVIRISGPSSRSILQSLSSAQTTLPKPRVATLRKLYHPTSREPLDQALVLYFAAPHSFTGEDAVELQCHGSRAVESAVLDAIAACSSDGTTTTTGSETSHAKIRLAEAGEFTQRAFASGKLDMLQVEALADLLSADTSLQRQLALQQLDGRLSTIYAQWRELLLAGLAHAEAVIDFGDDERLDDAAFAVDEANSEAAMQRQQENTWGQVAINMQSLQRRLQQQLLDDRRGELIRDGLTIAIVGPPNAGKSSLFNVLATREAAIVSPAAGTTRDVLELALNLGGVKCIVQDTAGIRNTNSSDATAVSDAIEQEGIQRAIRAASRADFVIAMVDSTNISSGLESIQSAVTIADENGRLTESNGSCSPWDDSSRMLLILNKSDLRDETDVDLESTTLSTSPFPLSKFGARYTISCSTQEGLSDFLADLTQRVTDRVSFTPHEASTGDSASSTSSSSEGLFITRARHRQHIQAASQALERFLHLSTQGAMAVDMAAEELRLACSELGRITGAIDVEDVLDKLFADFCIGK